MELTRLVVYSHEQLEYRCTYHSPHANQRLDLTPNVSANTIHDLPDERLAQIYDQLEDENLVNFAKAWNKIGGATRILTQFNIMRNRELLCFTLKKPYNKTKLGVGISIDTKGKKGTLGSEFELLSPEAFRDLAIRKSVHGLYFDYWLPVPISAPHYMIVKPEVFPRLEMLNNAARLQARSRAEIIYHFMNDVVVKLSDAQDRPSSQKSSLKLASEKAIESYYHFFHLLLCLTTEVDSIVDYANKKIKDFQDGNTSKTDCPNLGHLLLHVLISDLELSEATLKAVIKEAITRNVVWMLDGRGASRVKLAHMEEDQVCEYRLAKTFEASKTSYRLLLFFNLFRNDIQWGTGDNRKSLAKMRDELFDAHGAPQFGTAAKLAAEVKAVYGINDFFAFLEVMGINGMPSREVMTGLLWECIWDSKRKGNHGWGVNEEDAKVIRYNGGSRHGCSVTSFFPRTGRR